MSGSFGEPSVSYELVQSDRTRLRCGSSRWSSKTTVDRWSPLVTKEPAAKSVQETSSGVVCAAVGL